MWQEIGLYWPKVDELDKWGKRIKGHCYKTKAIFSYNNLEHEITSVRQPGGTAIVFNERLSSRCKETGIDHRNLGRWAWTRCGDENKLHTTFISAYRPCVSTSSVGTTTYDQHLRNIPINNEPRKLLLDDLITLIKSFQEKGDNIILGMDANEDITNRNIKSFMATLNLKNAVLSLHGNRCPSTTDAGDSDKPIDIIMCSMSLNPVNAGIDPDAGSTSDHAWVWADFRKEDLFGHDYRDYKKFTYKLKADDPRMAQKYSSLSLNQIKKQGIHEKLVNLLKIPVGQLSNDDINSFHKLSNDTTKIRQDTASKLRHIYTGEKPWSPDWKLAQNIKALWYLALIRRQTQNKIRKGKVSLKKIRRLMKLVNIRNVLSLPIDIVEKKYAEAQTKYIEACKNSEDLSDTHHDTLDEAMANKNQTSVLIERKKRKNIQKQKEAGRALTRLKRGERPMATKVFITTKQGRVECNNKEDIEWACITENKKRFSQVHTTPPMQTDILEWVGTCAENEAAEEILNGTADLSHIEDTYLKLLLENMRRPNIVTKHGLIPTNISISEHREGWRKQKSKTSSERSQLIFADFKAACGNKELSTIDRNFRQFPYKHGIANPAHTHFTDFQILKKAAVYDVEKMRTIQLMPAAFNMNNKKTGREVMALAEKLNLLPDEQAGSRKGHRSNLTALNKVLTNDLIRSRRLPTQNMYSVWRLQHHLRM